MAPAFQLTRGRTAAKQAQALSAGASVERDVGGGDGTEESR